MIPILAQMDQGGGIPIWLILIEIVLIAVVLASQWVIFTKAGKPGWAAIIPIYNLVVLLEIVGRPIWWILLMFLCFPVVFIIVMLDLAKAFGKDTIFAVGLILLGFIFLPLLAFGDATYRPISH